MGKSHASRNNKVHEFQALTSGRFTFMPDGEIGATDSRHGVFFGRFGSNLVAVKPTKNEAGAYHEAKMLEKVRSIGLTAVRPLCVVAGAGNDAFLLTERIPQLLSVASLPIANSDQRRVRESERIVKRVSQTLATMHGAGITHGDSQVKNFGLTGRGKPDVVVYDLEKGGTEQIGHAKTDPYSHDLDSLAQSLAYKGLGGQNIDYAADVLESVVLDPYYEHAVAAGLDPTLAESARQSAYSAFLGKRDDISFEQMHGGHDPRRVYSSPPPN